MLFTLNLLTKTPDTAGFQLAKPARVPHCPISGVWKLSSPVSPMSAGPRSPFASTDIMLAHEMDMVVGPGEQEETTGGLARWRSGGTISLWARRTYSFMRHRGVQWCGTR